MTLSQHTEETKELGLGSGQEAELVEAALRFGQRRDLILGMAFANPAWEIMLRLYLAELKDRGVRPDELVAATERSKATERWLDALEQGGLTHSVSPGGVASVRLTPHGKASMDALFASAQVGTPVS